MSVAGGKRVWTTPEIRDFIEMYQMFPELWDVKSALYKDRLKKQIAVRKISDEFGVSESEVQKKIHSLRTQFHQELRRNKTKRTDHHRRVEKCESKWEFFNCLKFILTSKQDSSPSPVPAINSLVSMNYYRYLW